MVGAHVGGRCGNSGGVCLNKNHLKENGKGKKRNEIIVPSTLYEVDARRLN